MKEIYKPLKNFEELYEISNLGNIKPLRGRCKGIVMKPRFDKKWGYLRVNLSKDKKLITKKIHRLVAETFIPYTGLNPDGTPIKGRIEVNHKDENKLNNSVENLEWCDGNYNTNYGTRNLRQSNTILEKKEIKNGKFRIIRK